MTLWPEHYPDQCPPADAQPADGVVFRFINSDRPVQKDFLSYYEKNSDRNWGELDCQARGLSIFKTPEACIAAAAIVPALKKKKIAKATLNEKCGVIASTPSRNTRDHYTLWSLFSSEELIEKFSLFQNLGGTNA